MKTYFNNSTGDLVWADDFDVFVQGSIPVKFIEFVEGCGYAIGDRIYRRIDESEALPECRALYVDADGFADPQNVYQLVNVVNGQSDDVVLIDGAMYSVRQDGSVFQV